MVVMEAAHRAECRPARRFRPTIFGLGVQCLIKVVVQYTPWSYRGKIRD